MRKAMPRAISWIDQIALRIAWRSLFTSTDRQTLTSTLRTDVRMQARTSVSLQVRARRRGVEGGRRESERVASGRMSEGKRVRVGREGRRGSNVWGVVY